GEGFIKITGEVGTGKTILCRKFLACLSAPEENFFTAYIPNPMLEPMGLLLALAEELSVPLPEPLLQHSLFKEINRRLLQLAVQGKRVVLCIDEAQAMPVVTLEALRLLTNLETEKRKLLQIVLFGQPELDAKLNLQEIRQLAQRITFQYQLQGLDLPQLHAYLAHRLQVAGYQREIALFAPPAVELLQQASAGVPRLVNILAHKSLMASFGSGLAQVGKAQMLAACRDTPAARGVGSLWARIKQRLRLWRSAPVGLVGLLCVLPIACIELLARGGLS
ncbi:MAG: AAA family ATPase, partial [Burkholderiales bacterium]|nr:AAA family ATPase [Burkholderiales bacterium]